MPWRTLGERARTLVGSFQQRRSSRLTSEQRQEPLEESDSSAFNRLPDEERVQDICLMCQRIDIHVFGPEDSDKQYSGEQITLNYGSQDDFLNSCSRCPFCFLMRREMMMENYPTNDHQLIIKVYPDYGPVIGGYRNKQTIRGLWISSSSRQFRLVLAASEGDIAADVIQRRPPVRGYHYRDASDLAHRWLRECSLMHKACLKILDVPLPARLIDVGDFFNEPKLFIAENGARGQYITLSYCWGFGQNVLLTQEKLEQKEILFPLANLPPTIRDSIEICRQLHFKYIWIDALCIVQDSVEGEDWAREASKMHEIYGNAALTIAAVAATSTSQGIFSSFAPHTQNPRCSLPYTSSDGKRGTIRVGAYSGSGSYTGPLDSRAWVLQESLLSTRIIRYGISQMSWDCKTVREHANGPLYDGWAGDPQQNRKWTDIVTDYSERQITRKSDRLAAISGYVRLLTIKDPSDKYIAGIWRSDFCRQLLWQRPFTTTSRESKRLSVYVAPSWSWASINEAVHFLDLSQQSIVSEVVEIAPSMLTRDSFEKVEESPFNYISLRGTLKAVPTRHYVWDNVFYVERQKSNRRCGIVTLDISEPFRKPGLQDYDYPNFVWCFRVAVDCALVLLAIPKWNGSNEDAYQRIGLLVGMNGFEDWYLDNRSGLCEQKIVRII